MKMRKKETLMQSVYNQGNTWHVWVGLILCLQEEAQREEIKIK